MGGKGGGGGVALLACFDAQWVAVGVGQPFSKRVVHDSIPELPIMAWGAKLTLGNEG